LGGVSRPNAAICKRTIRHLDDHLTTHHTPARAGRWRMTTDGRAMSSQSNRHRIREDLGVTATISRYSGWILADFDELID